MNFATIDVVKTQAEKYFGLKYVILDTTAYYICSLVNPFIKNVFDSCKTTVKSKTNAELTQYIQRAFPWIITARPKYISEYDQTYNPSIYDSEYVNLVRNYRHKSEYPMLPFLAETIIAFIINRIAYYLNRNHELALDYNIITPWDVVNTFIVDNSFVHPSQYTHIFNTSVRLDIIATVTNPNLPVSIDGQIHNISEEYAVGLLICHHVTNASFTLSIFGYDMISEYMIYTHRYTTDLHRRNYTIYISHSLYGFDNDLISGFIYGCSLQSINHRLYWTDIRDHNGHEFTIKQ